MKSFLIIATMVIASQFAQAQVAATEASSSDLNQVQEELNQVNEQTLPSNDFRAPFVAPRGGVRTGAPAPRPGGFTPRPGGFTPRPGGFVPRPGGYGPRPGGYFPRPGGYGPRPGGYFPRPGGYGPRGGWHWDPVFWHPGWWRQGFIFPIFNFEPNIPYGYVQCTAFNGAMEAFTQAGPDQDSAAYNALNACGGPDYQSVGCYIPAGYCQAR